MRTIFWGSETAVPMRCATRPCCLRIASVRSASAGVDHVAEADAHVEDLEHFAVVDAGVALDEGKDGVRLNKAVDLVADGSGDAGQVEQAVA